MTKPATSTRYVLVESAEGKMHLLSQTSFRILKSLLNGDKSYESYTLGKNALPINSVYVYAQRLEASGLLQRIKKVEGTPKRVRTLLKLSGPFKTHALRIIK